LVRRGTSVTFADEALPVGSVVDTVPVKFVCLEDIAEHDLLVTIGDNKRRAQVQRRAELLGLRLTTFVADPANYFAELPGPGGMVMAGAVVNVGATLGAGVIINSGAVVEHDCCVGAFAHISPGARLTGGCEVGEGAWIGAGATVAPHLVIAPEAVIGAGSTVIRDIPEPGVYAGVPARRIN
jgi:UDP-N-acetylbacillosamine N-acetyltransferase